MYRRLRNYLFRLDPERAHGIGVLAARIGQVTRPSAIASRLAFKSDRLATQVFDLGFENPVGIAAGFDKNAHLVRFWHAAGCGFMEVGSISARKCRGNPRPRAFRLPDDEALINRMGLNNQGASRVAKRLRSVLPYPFPVGVNVVKTHDASVMGAEAIADFVEGFRLIGPLGDYITLNISCPNTSEGKTFEDPESLDDLLTALAPVRSKVALGVPLLLKLSPPVSDRFVLDSLVDELLAVGESHAIDGYVAANTASDRDGLTTAPHVLDGIGKGGLSGPPLEERSTRLVRYLYAKTGGMRPIIGVGGVRDGRSAYRKIRAGASLLQLYTSLVYHGPGVVRAINEELDRLLAQDGIARISDAVGLDA